MLLIPLLLPKSGTHSDGKSTVISARFCDLRIAGPTSPKMKESP